MTRESGEATIGLAILGAVLTSAPVAAAAGSVADGRDNTVIAVCSVIAAAAAVRRWTVTAAAVGAVGVGRAGVAVGAGRRRVVLVDKPHRLDYARYSRRRGVAAASGSGLWREAVCAVARRPWLLGGIVRRWAEGSERSGADTADGLDLAGVYSRPMRRVNAGWQR